MRVLQFPELHDDAWMREQLETLSLSEIARKLGCSRRSVREAAARVGRQPNPPRKYPRLWDGAWLLDQLASGRSMQDIADEVGCSISAVRKASEKQGRQVARRPPSPLDVDAEWLRTALTTRRLSDVAKELGCGRGRVVRAARDYSIKIPYGPRRRFPELYDREWLNARADSHTEDDIAHELGCSPHAVHKATRLTGVHFRSRRSSP